MRSVAHCALIDKRSGQICREARMTQSCLNRTRSSAMEIRQSCYWHVTEVVGLAPDMRARCSKDRSIAYLGSSQI